MGSRTPDRDARIVAAFRMGLGEVGYTEGRNVEIRYRWTEGKYERLPAMIADLVRREVTVIAATAGTPSVMAAKAEYCRPKSSLTFNRDSYEILQSDIAMQEARAEIAPGFFLWDVHHCLCHAGGFETRPYRWQRRRFTGVNAFA